MTDSILCNEGEKNRGKKIHILMMIIILIIITVNCKLWGDTDGYFSKNRDRH